MGDLHISLSCLAADILERTRISAVMRHIKDREMYKE